MPDLWPPLTAADADAGITGVHPLAELFPPLTSEEFEALSTDVRRSGLQYAIVTDQDGLILDGLHRRRACIENGVLLRVVQTNRDPAKAVLSLNLTRRRLKDSQRAMIGIALYYANKENGNSTSVDAMAQQVGVALRTMERAKRVHDAESDKTRPGAGLSAQVRAGLTFKKADEQISRMRRALRPTQSPKDRAAEKASREAEAKRRAEIAARVEAHSVEGLARARENDLSLDLAVTPFTLPRRTDHGDDETTTEPETEPTEPAPKPEPVPPATFEDFKETTRRVRDADEFQLCRRWFLTHMTERL